MGGKALCRGRVQAKNCETIHSHPCESGVLVSEAKATFDGCNFYGNSLSGVVAQDKGMLRMFGCEVHYMTIAKEFSSSQMAART
jgi:hypothetical protein